MLLPVENWKVRSYNELCQAKFSPKAKNNNLQKCISENILFYGIAIIRIYNLYGEKSDF